MARLRPTERNSRNYAGEGIGATWIHPEKIPKKRVRSVLGYGNREGLNEWRNK